MALHLYDTLTRQLERFKPLKQDEVKVYYCGPTPYNYAHIGNLRTYLFEDFVIRSLRFLGYKVKTVMNITDIDDKTIRDSQKSGKTLKEHTEFYTTEFLSDIEKLSIEKADTIAPISTLIDEMGTMIQGLLDKGYAYIADDGSIYYSVRKFKKYGELAHLDMGGMISSVRINNDEYEKEQVADFALWKAYDKEVDGENFWEIKVRLPNSMSIQNESNSSEKRAPEGAVSGNTASEEAQIGTGSTTFSILKGRPGWHIECSACNRRFFGDQIDIHMGGIDNLFPHHQNEVAQTEAFTGKTFAKYWMHGGHLLVDNKKMSKSANNFYTLRDIIDKYAQNGKTSQMRSNLDEVGALERAVSGNTTSEEAEHGIQRTSISEVLVCRAFRLMALQNQYRENFNFTFERLGAAINTIKGLDEMMKRLGRYGDNLPEVSDERSARGKLKFHGIARDFRDNQQAFMQEFVERIENDFALPEAMAIVFDYQTYINAGIDEQIFKQEEVKSLIDLLRSWDEVLAIFDFSLLEGQEAIPKEVEALGVARVVAKSEKNWAEADRIRDELTGLGWKMIDEAGGKWRVERI